VDHGKNSPQQGNGVDCGVFVCINAEFISEGIPLLYSKLDLPLVRRKITAYLLSKELDY
jgi:Ulp1 family protease